MSQHPANLETSDRLKRVYDLLSGGREHSTMAIIQEAQVCAVNSIIDELRNNGVDVRCRKEGRLFFYKRWDL
ncbi:hypothetical protein [Candidatus Vondammii sp. HM_W22]|uniref:hypothetical protein n=1 Tax=Candidatus Vondammii sp. HM_W22 TaxID=2687299 RepID=UPI001F1374F8|nr:hypothetical protein [Candidatus Vondammii sp. HM_W22]